MEEGVDRSRMRRVDSGEASLSEEMVSVASTGMESVDLEGEGSRGGEVELEVEMQVELVDEGGKLDHGKEMRGSSSEDGRTDEDLGPDIESR